MRPSLKLLLLETNDHKAKVLWEIRDRQLVDKVMDTALAEAIGEGQLDLAANIGQHTTSKPELKRHEAVQIVGYVYNGQAIGHASDDFGNHAIVVGDKIGPWATYWSLARHGPWYATTGYYEGEWPRLFRVTEVRRRP